MDLRRHAIDEPGDHPLGVFKAQCGHLLQMVTPLRPEPYGRLCDECLAALGRRVLTGHHDPDRPPVEPSPRLRVQLPAAGRSQTPDDDKAQDHGR